MQKRPDSGTSSEMNFAGLTKNFGGSNIRFDKEELNSLSRSYVSNNSPHYYHNHANGGVSSPLDGFGSSGGAYSNPSSGGAVYNNPSAGGAVYNNPSAGGVVYNNPSAGGVVYNNPSAGGFVNYPTTATTAGLSPGFTDGGSNVFTNVPLNSPNSELVYGAAAGGLLLGAAAKKKESEPLKKANTVNEKQKRRSGSFTPSEFLTQAYNKIHKQKESIPIKEEPKPIAPAFRPLSDLNDNPRPFATVDFDDQQFGTGGRFRGTFSKTPETRIAQERSEFLASNRGTGSRDSLASQESNLSYFYEDENGNQIPIQVNSNQVEVSKPVMIGDTKSFFNPLYKPPVS